MRTPTHKRATTRRKIRPDLEYRDFCRRPDTHPGLFDARPDRLASERRRLRACTDIEDAVRRLRRTTHLCLRVGVVLMLWGSGARDRVDRMHRLRQVHRRCRAVGQRCGAHRRRPDRPGAPTARHSGVRGYGGQVGGFCARRRRHPGSGCGSPLSYSTTAANWPRSTPSSTRRRARRSRIAGRRAHREAPEAVVVLDIPLLVPAGGEPISGVYRRLDGIVVVDAAPDIAVARLVARRGFAVEGRPSPHRQPGRPRRPPGRSRFRGRQQRDAR